jgi:hypothetical protein
MASVRGPFWVLVCVAAAGPIAAAVGWLTHSIPASVITWFVVGCIFAQIWFTVRERRGEGL